MDEQREKAILELYNKIHRKCTTIVKSVNQLNSLYYIECYANLAILNLSKRKFNEVLISPDEFVELLSFIDYEHARLSKLLEEERKAPQLEDRELQYYTDQIREAIVTQKIAEANNIILELSSKIHSRYIIDFTLSKSLIPEYSNIDFHLFVNKKTTEFLDLISHIRKERWLKSIGTLSTITSQNKELKAFIDTLIDGNLKNIINQIQKLLAKFNRIFDFNNLHQIESSIISQWFKVYESFITLDRNEKIGTASFKLFIVEFHKICIELFKLIENAIYGNKKFNPFIEDKQEEEKIKADSDDERIREEEARRLRNQQIREEIEALLSESKIELSLKRLGELIELKAETKKNIILMKASLAENRKNKLLKLDHDESIHVRMAALILDMLNEYLME